MSMRNTNDSIYEGNFSKTKEPQKCIILFQLKEQSESYLFYEGKDRLNLGIDYKDHVQ